MKSILNLLRRFNPWWQEYFRTMSKSWGSSLARWALSRDQWSAIRLRRDTICGNSALSMHHFPIRIQKICATLLRNPNYWLTLIWVGTNFPACQCWKLLRHSHQTELSSTLICRGTSSLLYKSQNLNPTRLFLILNPNKKKKLATSRIITKQKNKKPSN
jgi:hypothetical protein